MPFTFSHPAIILPLLSKKKQWLSATGLIIGSITPDFECFIRMKAKSSYSHTLLGLLWFDLPLGLLLCFIYHNVVRNAFINNSPLLLKKRLTFYQTFNWTKYFSKYFFVICISLLIGSASHLFWDSFTHTHGFFVIRFSMIKTRINFGFITMRIYKIIQFFSSFIGGLIVVFAIMQLEKTPVKTSHQTYEYWLLIITISTAIVIVRFLFGLHYSQYGNVIATIISGVLIAFIVTPLVMRTG